MFKVGKSLPVVLGLLVVSAQASEAPEAPKTEVTSTPAPEAPKTEVAPEAPEAPVDSKSSDVKADDKDATKKAGIIAATVSAVTGGATWAKDLWVKDIESNTYYYSAQTAKVIAALAVVYGSYKLAQVAYNKYYGTEEEASYDYELNS